MSKTEGRRLRYVIDALRTYDEAQRKYGGKGGSDVEWIAFKLGCDMEQARALVTEARARMAEEDNER